MRPEALVQTRFCAVQHNVSERQHFALFMQMSIAHVKTEVFRWLASISGFVVSAGANSGL
jgi:hypothetical protein